jgi:Tol biopolymer transport system component
MTVLRTRFSKENRYYPALLLAFVVLLVCNWAGAEFIADDVTLTRLTEDGKSVVLSWSYHGELIAFIREVHNSQAQLMIMKSDGTDEQAVSPVGNPFFAEWSWAGSKLSYEYSNTKDDESQGRAYIYDVPTKRSMAISAPYAQDDFDDDDGPFWSADDQYVAYQVRPGPSERRQVWVADTQTGKRWWILAQRGQANEQRWSSTVPPKICLLTRSSGDDFDAATVSPDGRDLVLLTDIGAQNIEIDEPRWSPTGEWVAFTSDEDMTTSEREAHREDCWIARPDGSQARNLTKATSPATEEQLELDEPFWSWDGRWILCEGERLDNQGNEIATYYLIDPINGGYEPIMTSHPRRTRQYTELETAKWSYDSTKIAFVNQRSRVKNWGPDPEFERDRWVLTLYDVESRKSEDILILDEELDRKKIVADLDREDIGDISWSPDGRSIILTIATIVSDEDDIRRPDVYRLDLPERLIDGSAPEHIGPPMGREAAVAQQPPSPKQTAAKEPSPSIVQKPSVQKPAGQSGYVTEIVKPLHMTIEEAVASLPVSYQQYITVNPSRNLLLFKGPAKLLAAMRQDLQMIDTVAPQILVDMLAVELSDDATRQLGLDWTYAEGHFGFFQPSGSTVQKFGHVGTGEDHRVGFPSGALDSLSTLTGVGQSFYQGVGKLPREFFIRLNTLVTDGEGKILANPRTVGVSGKQSLIHIQKTLNYFFNEGFDVSGRPIVDKSDISATTEGRIIPTLLEDGRIHLVVEVMVGTFTFTQEAGLPEQTTRESKTEVSVQQGQTLILGGLRQQEMTSSTTKVPILGDIPLLGGLFKHEETEVRNTVLTIFITPQILTADNPVPDWPKLNGEDHEIVPIMDEEPPDQTKD